MATKERHLATTWLRAIDGFLPSPYLFISFYHGSLVGNAKQITGGTEKISFLWAKRKIDGWSRIKFSRKEVSSYFSIPLVAMERLYRLTCLVGGLVGQSVGATVGRSVGWLAGRLLSGSIGWGSVGGSVGLFVGPSVCRSSFLFLKLNRMRYTRT